MLTAAPIRDLDIKPIPGHPLYGATSDGRIWSRVYGGWRRKVNSRHKSGYLKVCLTKGKTFRVHRVIAETFLGPCPPGMEVNHIDGCRRNCAIWNLEYCTHVDNCRHGMWRRSITGVSI